MQKNCRSLRCSWSIACRRCSNFIFILDLTSGFRGSGKDRHKTGRESFKGWDLVRLILKTWRWIITKILSEMLRYYRAMLLSVMPSDQMWISSKLLTAKHRWKKSCLTSLRSQYFTFWWPKAPPAETVIFKYRAYIHYSDVRWSSRRLKPQWSHHLFSTFLF